MLIQNGVFPSKVRVSSGSAITLGLVEGFLSAKPRTAYLLTHTNGKCNANCRFCSQARESKSPRSLLSRVAWPTFSTEKVISSLKNPAHHDEIRRVCIQALNYPEVVEHLLAIVGNIKAQKIEIPISISCQPLMRESMHKLADAGVERIGISLDAATESLFERIKGSRAGGPYNWERQRLALLEAVEVFGKHKVSTHLIVGLGETEREMLRIIQWSVDNHVCPSLFAFTPISGTALEHFHPPGINSYRRVQLARHLIVEEKTRFKLMEFNGRGRISSFGVSLKILEEAVKSGRPFMTSGCPGCNRPYYNEKPSGPFYNFPRQPDQKEIAEISVHIQLS
ncbi:MAG: radical SAM protein [Candidatus Bathyarchaeota archaeon]|nr:MAG: radical SAM protein [Candidatus Bathyarchaeota archaeon]